MQTPTTQSTSTNSASTIEEVTSYDIRRPWGRIHVSTFAAMNKYFHSHDKGRAFEAKVVRVAEELREASVARGESAEYAEVTYVAKTGKTFLVTLYKDHKEKRSEMEWLGVERFSIE